MSSPSDASGDELERVRENRDAIKDLAESDLPVAWVAEALLDAADDAADEAEDH